LAIKPLPGDYSRGAEKKEVAKTRHGGKGGSMGKREGVWKEKVPENWV